MPSDFPIPETRVLAIASHVVYGYVGNTMATFVMQSLGAEVAALNTVHFSNHTGYGQTKGTKTTADEIVSIYSGLQQSHLTDFDMMLTGYAPSAEAVSAVGQIAKDLKKKAQGKPGSFFWVLDPVMGDEGRLYVSPQVPPAYQALLPHADLILPNQFEAETLSSIKITSLASLHRAISYLHTEYQIPHVLVTSISLPSPPGMLTVVGSTSTSDGRPRLFVLRVPELPVHFNGTGDMLAALVVVRLREAVLEAGEAVAGAEGWRSPDDVAPTQLPLARAVEKVLSSMQMVLERTTEVYQSEMEKVDARNGVVDGVVDEEKLHRLRWSKAAEVRVVRNVECLRNPKVRFRAEALDVQGVEEGTNGHLPN
ncbi:MAG: putative pyridoxal kinase [Cirrosporium novae-zelandiae]|nr:MAG: putative pyridoxal kinase [Cirrosporium novae-zelandiae]